MFLNEEVTFVWVPAFVKGTKDTSKLVEAERKAVKHLFKLKQSLCKLADFVDIFALATHLCDYPKNARGAFNFAQI